MDGAPMQAELVFGTAPAAVNPAQYQRSLNQIDRFTSKSYISALNQSFMAAIRK
jgi:hypothetical protein